MRFSKIPKKNTDLNKACLYYIEVFLLPGIFLNLDIFRCEALGRMLWYQTARYDNDSHNDNVFAGVINMLPICHALLFAFTGIKCVFYYQWLIKAQMSLMNEYVTTPAGNFAI